MPTTLGPKYNIAWRGNPPHMLAVDVPIWYRFLEKWGWQLTALYYDCTLGGPFITPEEKKDPIKRMWAYNLSSRADAVAETATDLLIIEVASDPGLRALGQVQTYRALWIRDPIILKPEKVVLVCERIRPDLLDAASMYGVLVYVV